MSAMKRFFAVMMAGAVLSVLSPVTVADAACYVNNDNERAFASKVNAARRAAGKSSLRLDPQLSKAAKVHTREMIRRNVLYHTPTETLKRRVTNWVQLGENVGVGGTVTSLNGAFMDSAAHRSNILYNEFRYVGVGAKKANGRLWVTFIFESQADPGSPLC